MPKLHDPGPRRCAASSNSSFFRRALHLALQILEQAPDLVRAASPAATVPSWPEEQYQIQL